MTEKKDHLRILRAIHNKNLSLPQGELEGGESLNSGATTPLNAGRESAGVLSTQDMVILPNYNNQGITQKYNANRRHLETKPNIFHPVMTADPNEPNSRATAIQNILSHTEDKRFTAS
jgi:hypothetical protein